MKAEFQPIYLGHCHHCGANCYWNEDNYKTHWQGGDNSCLHEIKEERSEDANDD